MMCATCTRPGAAFLQKSHFSVLEFSRGNLTNLPQPSQLLLLCLHGCVVDGTCAVTLALGFASEADRPSPDALRASSCTVLLPLRHERTLPLKPGVWKPRDSTRRERSRSAVRLVCAIGRAASKNS